MRYFYLFCILFICFLPVKSDVIIEVSKSTINFGEVPYCKKITDTIVVKNSPISTANLKLLVGERITGTNSTSFRITNPKIKDLDLPPYDGTNSVIYIVEFDPSIQPFGDKNAILEIPNDTKDSVLKIPISAKSVMIEYEILPQVIDFQDISINQEYTKNLEITIKSNFNTKISSVYWKNNQSLTLDLSGGLDLIPNFKTILPVKIKLNNLGTFNDTLELKINEPCDTVFKIPVKANAPNGFIEGFRNLNFGILSDCENKSDSLTIKLSGYGSGQINSIEIEGDGSENIQVNFDKSLPIQFTNGSQETIKISLQPNNKNYGKKKVLIKFNAEINFEIKQYTILIDYEIAEVRLNSNTTKIDFANTYPSQIDSKEIEISNPTPFDIQIDKIDFVCPNNDAFSFEPQNLPIIITKGNKQSFLIHFIPQKQNTNYDCKLELSFSSQNCQKSLSIDLSAKSLSKANLQISFSDLKQIEIDPKSEFFALPISINTTEGEITLNDTLFFEISFPRSIFKFENIQSSNTSLVNNSIDNNKRKLSFRTIFNGTKITTQKFNFGTLEGIPLLGDVANGHFAFDSYYFASKSNSFQLSKADSLPFNLIVCDHGEQRLLLLANQNKSIIEIANINDSFLEININAIESGKNKLFLIDILGNQVINQDLTTQCQHINKLYLNIQSLSKGIYFIVLMTPSEIYSNKILIK